MKKIFAGIVTLCAIVILHSSAVATTITIVYKCNGETSTCHTIKGSGDIELAIPGTLAAGYPKIVYSSLVPPCPSGMSAVDNIFLHDPTNPGYGWGYTSAIVYVDSNGNGTGEFYVDDSVTVITSFASWKNAVGLP
jgi:hypothetical protein